MKYISTIIILFTILNGCTSEKLSEQKLKQVIITGKEYATFEEKESRNDISGQLEENSIISLYGIILPNYNGILISRTRLSVPITLTWRMIILRYMNLTEN